VLAELARIKAEMDDMLVALDPASMHALDAVKLVDAFTAVEHCAMAGRALVADRAADSAEWTRDGFRSPEEWLAHKTGTSYGAARDILAASSKLDELPQLNQALRKGELSGAQLNEIGSAATPENETRLLDAKKNEAFGGLRKKCAEEKAKARSVDDEAARHARIHKDRYHRSWSDAEGAYCYEGRTTADVGARVDAAIAAETERVFKAAYAEGRREPSAAYRSDAVANLVTGGGASVDTTVVIRVDEARLRGDEGLCEAGGMPVPVDAAIGEILAGAFVKVVVTDGVDVMKVAHVGRHIPAELKTAIFERDGYRCVRPGCSSGHRLEVHHYKVDFAKGGPTAYWNVGTTCDFDHDLITYGGHRLEGGPGDWKWIEPP
jgi:hypothetical protein